MRKKIGVITLPLNNNFGGILQAYALCEFLKNLEFEPILLDKQQKQPKLALIKLKIKSFLGNKKLLSNKEIEIINQNPTRFIQDYIKSKSPRLYNSKQLKKFVLHNNLDAVIVGSDQVWRMEYAKDFYKTMFLDFVPKGRIKKVSYAASFGVDKLEINKDITNEIKYLLKDFDAVSVREDSGVILCNDYFETEALHHIDPTLLLTINHYKSLVDLAKEKKSPGEILIYMLDLSGDRKLIVDKVKNELGKQTFSVNKKIDFYADGVESKIYPTVTSWLKGFIDAEYTVIDSFHGTIFSILFNIPFIAYGNRNRGLTRFESVLKLFNLEDRLITDFNQLSEELIHKKIDWAPINQKIDALRNETEKYFISNL
ncbi:polysaccharide pyruvyl transferase family protein [Croceivirga sp. JEA036]|uniref:polysaccharide pyruvyl transferase family protein n=1 Tax=Croceivirga sp. JEA036 TaxID=2721162 RepID=UPI00143B3368|nr:polysaccharide pyruvyl transferase family protein [Croceivirga sp. JEA036]NJB35386.1 polysaccharide pyruvyl transferase family protein [Croceivirga sp. JEA036]